MRTASAENLRQEGEGPEGEASLQQEPSTEEAGGSPKDKGQGGLEVIKMDTNGRHSNNVKESL